MPTIFEEETEGSEESKSPGRRVFDFNAAPQAAPQQSADDLGNPLLPSNGSGDRHSFRGVGRRGVDGNDSSSPEQSSSCWKSFCLSTSQEAAAGTGGAVEQNGPGDVESGQGAGQIVANADDATLGGPSSENANPPTDSFGVRYKKTIAAAITFFLLGVGYSAAYLVTGKPDLGLGNDDNGNDDSPDGTTHTKAVVAVPYSNGVAGDDLGLNLTTPRNTSRPDQADCFWVDPQGVRIHLDSAGLDGLAWIFVIENTTVTGNGTNTHISTSRKLFGHTGFAGKPEYTDPAYNNPSAAYNAMIPVGSSDSSGALYLAGLHLKSCGFIPSTNTTPVANMTGNGTVPCNEGEESSQTIIVGSEVPGFWGIDCTADGSVGPNGVASSENEKGGLDVVVDQSLGDNVLFGGIGQMCNNEFAATVTTYEKTIAFGSCVEAEVGSKEYGVPGTGELVDGTDSLSKIVGLSETNPEGFPDSSIQMGSVGAETTSVAETGMFSGGSTPAASLQEETRLAAEEEEEADNAFYDKALTS